MKKFSRTISLIAAAMLTLSGCGQTSAPAISSTVSAPSEEVASAGQQATRTVTDLMGRQVELPQEINSVICTGSGALRLVCYAQGADLVTEGIFTLSRAARYLESGEFQHNDPAGQLVELMRRNDIINFLVGTRINEAHQDPNLPVDLELRRNIVKRLGDVLRNRYMKEVNIHFV